MVEVEHHRGQRRAIADGALELFLKPALQVAVVQEVRPIVGDRQLQELLVRLLELAIGALQGGIEVALLEGGAEHRVELVEVERLDDEIIGPALERLDLAADVALDGHDDHGDRRHHPVLLDRADHLDAVGGRDQEIEQDQVGPVAGDPLQRLGAARGGEALIPLHREPFREQIGGVPIIVDDQDAEPARWRRDWLRRDALSSRLHRLPRPTGGRSFAKDLDRLLLASYSIPPRSGARNDKSRFGAGFRAVGRQAAARPVKVWA